LIKLVYEDGLSIIRASEIAGIRYPTAKTITDVFFKEQRIAKRSFRYRTKKNDLNSEIHKNNVRILKNLRKIILLASSLKICRHFVF
jgi:hypothetical protein